MESYIFQKALIIAFIGGAVCAIGYLFIIKKLSKKTISTVKVIISFLLLVILIFIVVYQIQVPKYDLKIIKEIALENSDEDVLKNITEHLNRKNQSYTFINSKFTRDVKEDEKCEKKITEKYTLEWRAVNSQGKDLGEYKMTSVIEIDNYKYAKNKVNIIIKDSILDLRDILFKD